MTPVTQPQPDTRLANFVEAYFLPKEDVERVLNKEHRPEDGPSAWSLIVRGLGEQPHFTGIGTRRVKDDGN